MEITKKQLQEMYDFSKKMYEDEDMGMDIYGLKRLYNEIADEFGLDIAFGVDGCEYGGDDEIYCYIHVDEVGSIVFNRSVGRYTDGNFYKDTVDYLLKLQDEAESIKKKILPLKK